MELSLLIIPLLLVGLGLGYEISRMHGRHQNKKDAEKLGRDKEWCDQLFAKIEADKARRDKQGRFKAKQ
jgi:glucose-6-phosphate-specific signal transduction histidine kinase